MGKIVKMYLCATLSCLYEVDIGRSIRAEHNVPALCSHSFRQHKLGKGGAIKAAALLHQYLHNIRVRRSLYRKVFTESLVP